ncbi:helix-turn-helix transcriptional regulator [Kitasatospora sp. MBT66]|uniref:helix-turn-helix domain-containing protein n=1 Tax=Kitasatospora sp. MBT66 TaxID=1444769 RepID=UPI0009E755DF|nr:helix-turn-helix transcriptional regulator [Kitasatospora sp. MBT66]
MDSIEHPMINQLDLITVQLYANAHNEDRRLPTVCGSSQSAWSLGGHLRNSSKNFGYIQIERQSALLQWQLPGGEGDRRRGTLVQRGSERAGMAAAAGPTVRRRQLGAELRRRREEAGLSHDEVADALTGMSQPKLSRIENGRGATKVDDVKKLLSLYKCEDSDLISTLVGMAKNGSQRGMWWQSYSAHINSTLGDLITLEATASSVRNYEGAFVPGLLQTPAYAREIIKKLNMRPDVNVEALVDVRMARQSALTRSEPLTLWAVIHEAAIRSGVGGPAVMAEQLSRLIDRAAQPNINVQVMPIGAPAHHGMGGAFTILGFPQRQDLDVVMVDGTLSNLWVEEAVDVDVFAAKFDAIRADALGLDDSLAIITDQRDKIT